MIVVTAPTGNIGSSLLGMLLERDANVRVVARDPSKISAKTLGRIDVIEGSHSQQDVMTTALNGAEALFWLVPGDPTALNPHVAFVDFTRAACGAIADSSVKRVVGISALGRGWPKDAGYVTATLEADDLIAATGVPYRALACGSLMENILRQAGAIKEAGAFYWPSPAQLKQTAVAIRDIAATAASLLLDRSWDGVD